MTLVVFSQVNFIFPVMLNSIAMAGRRSKQKRSQVDEARLKETNTGMRLAHSIEYICEQISITGMSNCEQQQEESFQHLRRLVITATEVSKSEKV